MRIPTMGAALCLAFLVLGGSSAGAEYKRIGPGPTLDYALAYCDNASMGVGQGYFAFGSPGFVGSFALGNAIGNAIRRSRFKQNCMVMNGWKWLPDHAPAVRTHQNFNSGCLGARCN